MNNINKISYDILRTTVKAAISAYPLVGCGDKNKVDSVAVQAMRDHLNSMDMQGRIVIGEGEIDEAPMLYIGEQLGSGEAPAVDIAVDPIEGTRMVAMGQSDALAVIAVAPQGTLLNAPDMYMRKLVVGAKAKGAIDLSKSLTDNLHQIAQVLDKPVQALHMVTIDKARMHDAIAEARNLGVKVFVLPDGDVAASVMTCLPDAQYDLMYTIGGSPEGVISGCAVKTLGGDMQVELIDFCQAKGESEHNRQIADSEHQRCEAMQVKINHIYTLDEMVLSDDVLFSATGVTNGDLVSGVKQVGDILQTDTLFINGVEGTCSRVESWHYK